MAVAVPEVAAGGVELGLGAIAFTALVSILLMRGLISAWQVTFGAVFAYLADNLDFSFSKFGVHVPLDLGAPFKYVDHYVLKVMQKALKESEHLLGWSLHAMATVAEWVTSETLSFAQATEQALERLGHIHVPKAIKVAVATASLAPLLPRYVRTAIAGEAATLRHYVDARLKSLEGEIATALKKAVPHIPGVGVPAEVWHDLHTLKRWFNAHSKRIARLEKLLGASGLLALITATFGREIARLIRCPNVKNSAKAICGFNPALLESLLADGALIVGTLSIVEFAKALQAVTPDAAKMLVSIVDEL